MRQCRRISHFPEAWECWDPELPFFDRVVVSGPLEDDWKKMLKRQENRLQTIGLREVERPKGELIHSSTNPNPYGKSISVAQARNVPVHGGSGVKGDSGNLVIGIHTVTSGYLGGSNVNDIPVGQVILPIDAAKRFVTAIQEQIAREERDVELEQPKFIEVSVRVPVDRAGHPAHAKNLVQRALDDYYSENGSTNAQVVGEAKVVSGKDA